MATVTKATRTVLVNAAFLQEVKDANPVIWTVRDRLHVMTCSEPENSYWESNIVPLFQDLRTELSLQFRLEETYGYIHAPSCPADRVAEQAAMTLFQHCVLYLLVHEVCEQLEEAQFRGVLINNKDSLYEQVLDFRKQWDEHENLESDLVRGKIRPL